VTPAARPVKKSDNLSSGNSAGSALPDRKV
jgi:hypothetical protein